MLFLFGFCSGKIQLFYILPHSNFPKNREKYKNRETLKGKCQIRKFDQKPVETRQIQANPCHKICILGSIEPAQANFTTLRAPLGASQLDRDED